VGALSGSAGAKPSSSAVSTVGKLKTRQKEVGFQILVGAAQKLHASLDAINNVPVDVQPQYSWAVLPSK